MSRMMSGSVEEGGGDGDLGAVLRGEGRGALLNQEKRRPVVDWMEGFLGGGRLVRIWSMALTSSFGGPETPLNQSPKRGLDLVMQSELELCVVMLLNGARLLRGGFVGEGDLAVEVDEDEDLRLPIDGNLHLSSRALVSGHW